MDMQNINDLFEAYIAEEDSNKKEFLLNMYNHALQQKQKKETSIINILCFLEGAHKPNKHRQCMAKVCTYLKNDGHKVRVGYVSLAGLEALDNRGVNTMSEAVPGERVWLIVYDEDRPCKSYTNEDIHYYKEFVDLFSSRLKRRLYYEAMLNELTVLKT